MANAIRSEPQSGGDFESNGPRGLHSLVSRSVEVPNSGFPVTAILIRSRIVIARDEIYVGLLQIPRIAPRTAPNDRSFRPSSSMDTPLTNQRGSRNFPVDRVTPVIDAIQRNQRDILPLPRRPERQQLVSRLDPGTRIGS